VFKNPLISKDLQPEITEIPSFNEDRSPHSASPMNETCLWDISGWRSNYSWGQPWFPLV